MDKLQFYQLCYQLENKLGVFKVRKCKELRTHISGIHRAKTKKGTKQLVIKLITLMMPCLTTIRLCQLNLAKAILPNKCQVCGATGLDCQFRLTMRKYSLSIRYYLKTYEIIQLIY